MTPAEAAKEIRAFAGKLLPFVAADNPEDLDTFEHVVANFLTAQLATGALQMPEPLDQENTQR